MNFLAIRSLTKRIQYSSSRSRMKRCKLALSATSAQFVIIYMVLALIPTARASEKPGCCSRAWGAISKFWKLEHRTGARMLSLKSYLWYKLKITNAANALKRSNFGKCPHCNGTGRRIKKNSKRGDFINMIARGNGIYDPNENNKCEYCTGNLTSNDSWWAKARRWLKNFFCVGMYSCMFVPEYIFWFMWDRFMPQFSNVVEKSYMCWKMQSKPCRLGYNKDKGYIFKLNQDDRIRAKTDAACAGHYLRADPHEKSAVTDSGEVYVLEDREQDCSQCLRAWARFFIWIATFIMASFGDLFTLPIPVHELADLETEYVAEMPRETEMGKIREMIEGHLVETEVIGKGLIAWLLSFSICQIGFTAIEEFGIFLFDRVNKWRGNRVWGFSYRTSQRIVNDKDSILKYATIRNTGCNRSEKLTDEEIASIERMEPKKPAARAAGPTQPPPPEYGDVPKGATRVFPKDSNVPTDSEEPPPKFESLNVVSAPLENLNKQIHDFVASAIERGGPVEVFHEVPPVHDSSGPAAPSASSPSVAYDSEDDQTLDEEHTFNLQSWIKLEKLRANRPGPVRNVSREVLPEPHCARSGPSAAGSSGSQEKESKA